MDAPSEYRVNCSDGSAVEIILDTPEELGQLESYRSQAAADRRLQQRREDAVRRLRKHAETDLVLDDLLIVLGLS